MVGGKYMYHYTDNRLVYKLLILMTNLHGEPSWKNAVELHKCLLLNNQQCCFHYIISKAATNENRCAKEMICLPVTIRYRLLKLKFILNLNTDKQSHTWSPRHVRKFLLIRRTTIVPQSQTLLDDVPSRTDLLYLLPHPLCFLLRLSLHALC
jgi:hypothetical protein